VTHPELSAPGDWTPDDPEGETLDGLQRRINSLKTRIHDSVPAGYDLSALIAVGGESAAEDVFDITSDELALIGLTGPLIVPGSQPQPAFADDSGRPVDTATGHRFRTNRGRWGRVALLLVVAAALAAASYFGGVWWASRGNAGDQASLGAVAPLVVTLG